jgi:hypothetical protein
MPKLYKTGTRSFLIKQAIKDAIDYQYSYIDAWTPNYRDPDEEAKKIIKETQLIIKDYERLLRTFK